MNSQVEVYVKRAWDRNRAWVKQRYPDLTEEELKLLQSMYTLALPDGEIMITPRTIVFLAQRIMKLEEAVAQVFVVTSSGAGGVSEQDSASNKNFGLPLNEKQGTSRKRGSRRGKKSNRAAPVDGENGVTGVEGEVAS